ncbi:MAG: hypothetical protein QME58_14385, partial [Bacteroidota bacterium]|nr:hypothetical protein [Bacteroidota bacterium]
FVVSCRERVVPPDVPPYIPPIVLTAEDVGVTDAWLRIKTTASQGHGAESVQLKRDGQTIFILSSSLLAQSSPLDTLILDEGLLPKQTYTYKAFLHQTDTPPLQSPVDSSAPLLLTTMDTTSHNFTWEIDTLGDGAGSVLRDVCIINDTCVWAVGEIYKRDSAGNFETEPYNTARWNGKKWELKRIQFYTFCGPGSLTGPYPANAVFAFDDGEIWIASQSQIAKWKNGVQISITCLPVSVNKIWGSNKNNVYTAGPLGQIGFFNGVSWRRLESGTDVSINDIWGSVDEKTGKRLILCAASNIWEPGERKILKINENNTID